MIHKLYNKKLLTRLFLSLFTFSLLIILIVIFISWNSRPKIEGEVRVPFISENVDVYRDEFGIPHLYGQSKLDLYYSLGQIFAADRLFQMDIVRRVASGRLAEIIGEKGLKSDLLFRTLKLNFENQKIAKNWQMPFEMEQIAKAFYKGVNDYKNKHSLPIEFKILNYSPEDFTINDAYSLIGMMSFNFAISTYQEPLMSALKSKYTDDLLDQLRMESIESKSKKVLTYQKLNRDVLNNIAATIEFLETGFPIVEGSNAWILSGKRTKSGFPMLANDPHISFSQPSVWYEAHLETNEFNLYGYFLPLVPFAAIGHDKLKAWGLTMTLTDDMDLYQEKIDLENLTYLYDGKNLPLKSSEVEIRIKGKKSFKFNLYETHHGPLLDHVLEIPSVSLKWAFHHMENDPLLAFYQMAESKNIKEFESAVSLGNAPGLNVLYADKENIAWWMFGDVAKKPKNLKTDFILDGTNSNEDYHENYKFSEKPHAINPASGLIVSANQRPDDFVKTERGDWQPKDRYWSILKTLETKEIWSIEETKELQSLSFNIENKIMLTELMEDLKNSNIYNRLAKDLSNWNFISEADSKEPVIFYIWQRNILKNLLKDLSEKERELYFKLPAHWQFFNRVIKDRHSPWWTKFNRKKLIEDSLVETYLEIEKKLGPDESNWKWGKIHTIEYSHPLGKIKPLDKIFNLGPYPINGASQEINNQKTPSFDSYFQVRAGPSTRRIIDMKDDSDDFAVIPTGQSGHLWSPFYKDQVPLYLASKYRPMLTNKDQIIKGKHYHLIFRPEK